VLLAILAYTLPYDFSPTQALSLGVERADVDEQTPLPIKGWKGVRRGFFRNARGFLHADYRISPKPVGALMEFYAAKGGAFIRPAGGPLYRETFDGDWEQVSAGGRRMRPNEVYRAGDKGPFVRVATRGR